MRLASNGHARKISSIMLVAGGSLLFLAFLLAGPREILNSVLGSLREDTSYSSGYSESSFQQIVIGDTEGSVRAALGTPLSESIVEPFVRWLYVPDSAVDVVPGFQADGRFPDMRFSFTSIEFDAQGTFVDAIGQISDGSSSVLIGPSASTSFGDALNTLSITKAEIEKLKAEGATYSDVAAKFGKPNAVFESRVAKWLQYSHSPRGTHYRQRLIGIDEHGKVCRKVDDFYWD